LSTNLTLYPNYTVTREILSLVHCNHTPAITSIVCNSITLETNLTLYSNYTVTREILSLVHCNHTPAITPIVCNSITLDTLDPFTPPLFFIMLWLWSLIHINSCPQMTPAPLTILNLVLKPFFSVVAIWVPSSLPSPPAPSWNPTRCLV